MEGTGNSVGWPNPGWGLGGYSGTDTHNNTHYWPVADRYYRRSTTQPWYLVPLPEQTERASTNCPLGGPAIEPHGINSVRYQAHLTRIIAFRWQLLEVIAKNNGNNQ